MGKVLNQIFFFLLFFLTNTPPEPGTVDIPAPHSIVRFFAIARIAICDSMKVSIWARELLYSFIAFTYLGFPSSIGTLSKDSVANL